MEDNSNYIQLLRLREDDQRVISWLQKKTDKYTSGEAQNELLKIMAHQVLHKVGSNLQGTLFLTVMADETTDISNREQVMICLRWVSEISMCMKSLLVYMWWIQFMPIL